MAKVNLEIQCIVQSLNIRKGPSMSDATTGKLLSNGEKAVVIERNDSTGWYKLQDGRGWVSGGASYVKVIKNLDDAKKPAPTPTPTGPTVTAPDVKVQNTAGMSGGLDKEVIKMLIAQSEGVESGRVDASTRLFGGPHQFNEKVDFRITDHPQLSLGRKYFQNMVTEAPIVYFMPGKPNYLPEMDKDQKNAFKDVLLSSNSDKNNIPIIDSIISGKDSDDYRYYNFLADYSSYIRYVNLLCRSAAIYLGIGDKTAPASSKPYKSYNWANYRYESLHKPSGELDDESGSRTFNLMDYVSNAWKGLFDGHQYTQFYVDPSLSFNETTSNNTSQSKLEGFFDTAEGAVKELAFLLDAGNISRQGESLQQFSGSIDSLKGNLGNQEGFFARLLGATSNVISGANMIFPQIWGDAAYNKTYNITVNLVSPYGDKESIFLNCIVPMLHLMALAIPRQYSANSYAAPFLVRVFAKGWFSCEMGIIDNITIEKGGQGSWTVDGLPSEIRVSLNVRDMYSHMMLSKQNKPGLFFQNFSLIDFLAVTCGVNITRPNFATQLELFQWTLGNRFLDVPSNIAEDMLNYARNKFEWLYKLQ